MKCGTLPIRLLLLTLFFINGYAQKAQTDSLTLNQAIRITLSNQPLLQQALEQVNAAEAKIKQQNSFYYPRLEGNLIYARIGPIPSIEFSGHSFELAPANNYNAYIIASQVVFDFGRRSALLNLSRTYKLTSADKINLIKNNLTYQTIQSFYTILFLEKGIAVKNEQINTLEKHLDVTRKKVQSGSATDFDILTTQVKVADTRNQKIEIDNMLNKEELRLKSLLGWPSDSALELTGELKADSVAVDLESLLSAAFNNRPELKLAQDAEKNALLARRVASLSDRPTMSVLASYGFKNGYEPNLDVLRGNWVAGLNASVPIFNGNLKNARVEEAVADQKAASAGTTELQRNIKLEVEQAASDLKANRLKIKTAVLQVEQASQAVSRAELQYQDGVITNLDLIDSETSLAQARLSYLQVIYQNVLSYYNLKKAAGEIVVQ